MLSRLPPEVCLHILEFFTLDDLACLAILSKTYHDFLRAQEETIYRNAAILHGFISPGNTLADVERTHQTGWTSHLKGWRDFCASTPECLTDVR
jgi:hypothetical protein